MVWHLKKEFAICDVDAQISGIKFWKGDEIPRPVYKKNFSQNWEVASILDFLVHKKYTMTILWDEFFFF